MIFPTGWVELLCCFNIRRTIDRFIWGEANYRYQFLTCRGSVWSQLCCDCASPSLLLLRNYILKLRGFLVIGSRHIILLFICRKRIVCYVILLKTRVNFDLTYLKVDRLVSFVFSYSFLLCFNSALFLKERSPNFRMWSGFRMWFDCVSELQGMRSSRTAGSGEVIEPAASRWTWIATGPSNTPIPNFIKLRPYGWDMRTDRCNQPNTRQFYSYNGKKA